LTLFRQQLVPYLPQLHQFVQDVGPKLAPGDLIPISDGIAHVISAMPPSDAISALQLFCNPIIEQANAVVSSPQVATKAELVRLGGKSRKRFRWVLTTKNLTSKNLSDNFDRLEKFLCICMPLNESLPASCEKTCADAWTVIDRVLSKYGHVHSVSEHTCGLIRRSLDFFYQLLLPVLVPMLQRLTTSFQTTGFSAYMWITTKTIPIASNKPQLVELQQATREAFEKQSEKVFALLPTAPLDRNEDGTFRPSCLVKVPRV
jgi:transportin-3